MSAKLPGGRRRFSPSLSARAPRTAGALRPIFSRFLAALLLVCLLLTPLCGLPALAAAQDPGAAPAAASGTAPLDAEGEADGAAEGAVDEGAEDEEAPPVPDVILPDIPGWPTPPEIGAEGAILLDADTGVVLYEKNADRILYPASTTKLLTSLIAYESLELNDTVPFSHEAVYSVPPDGSSISMGEGETISVEQTLYAILTASANECANAIGEKISGSIPAFGETMTARARELGCTNSHFVNPSGLFEEDHYTTPRDLSRIARAFFDVPLLASMSGTVTYRIPPSATQPDDIWIRNHNVIINGELPVDAHIIGGKTGFTNVARASLVTCAERDGLRLISVVMKAESPGQYNDTATLLHYGFDHFVRRNLDQMSSEGLVARPAFLQSGATLLGSPVNTLSVSAGWQVLPREADPEEIDVEVTYRERPEIVDRSEGRTGVIADISYLYRGLPVGSAQLLSTKNPVVTIEPLAEEEETAAASSAGKPSFRSRILSRYGVLQNDTYYVRLPLVLRDVSIAAVLLAALFFGVAYLRTFNFESFWERKNRI